MKLNLAGLRVASLLEHIVYQLIDTCQPGFGEFPAVCLYMLAKRLDELTLFQLQVA